MSQITNLRKRIKDLEQEIVDLQDNQMLLLSDFIEGFKSGIEKDPPITKEDALKQKQETEEMYRQFNGVSMTDFANEMSTDLHNILADNSKEENTYRYAAAGLGVLFREFVDFNIKPQKNSPKTHK
jgi:hypothetical protein